MTNWSAQGCGRIADEFGLFAGVVLGVECESLVEAELVEVAGAAVSAEAVLAIVGKKILFRVG